LETLVLKSMYTAYSTNPNLGKVRQQAVNLVYRGWSVRQTARYIGVQPGTVSKWLDKDRPPEAGKLLVDCVSPKARLRPAEGGIFQSDMF